MSNYILLIVSKINIIYFITSRYFAALFYCFLLLLPQFAGCNNANTKESNKIMGQYTTVCSGPKSSEIYYEI